MARDYLPLSYSHDFSDDLEHASGDIEIGFKEVRFASRSVDIRELPEKMNGRRKKRDMREVDVYVEEPITWYLAQADIES
jgi:hypothetical protein